MAALHTHHDVHEARRGQKSRLAELREMLRPGAPEAGFEELDGLISEIEALSRDLIAWRKRTNMLPCAACGSPFLPEMDYPVCADCGAVHGECPHCGEGVIDGEVHCDPEAVD